MSLLLLHHLLYFAILNVAVVLVGYPILKSGRLLPGWLMLAAGIFIIHIIFLYEHPVIRMLAIIATTFSGMKVIAVTAGYKNKPLTLSFKQWLVYAVGWVGMRAQPFETLGQMSVPGGGEMVKFGLSRIAAGGLMILAAHGVVRLHAGSTFTYILVTSLLLVGFSLILHFGFLSISAGMWRFSGVNTYYLFRQPAKALSLTELWSKRWNIAFSEMTSVAIFRPLRARTSAPVALMAAFTFSGFLHELALSVPVNSGFGLPTLYFVIQGTIVMTERYFSRKKINFLTNTFVARVWVLYWLIAPMPLLFHEGFIRRVIWPLAGLQVY